MNDPVNSLNSFQPAERQIKDPPASDHDPRSQAGLPSMLLGSGVALFGLTRRSFRGTALALLGAGVVFTGAWSRRARPAHETAVRYVLTINRPRHEVYEQWRRLEDLPGRMKNLQSVEKSDERHSHWSAKGLLGYIVAWDAETTQQEQDTRISWRSLLGATVPNHGSVRFSDAPNGRGTELEVTMSCRLPAGILGPLLARLGGRSPQSQVESDLRRFKAILEGGEAPTTSDQAAGERSLIGRLTNSWAGSR